MIVELDKVLREKKKNNTNKVNIKGRWILIQYSPDSVTDEYLNFGVGFIADSEDEVSVKLLDDHDKLVALYGNEISFHAAMVHSFIESGFKESGSDIDLIRSKLPKMIRVKEKGFAQGESINSILNLLYREVVTLAKK